MLITAYEQLLTKTAISTELGKALETIDLQKLIHEGCINEMHIASRTAEANIINRYHQLRSELAVTWLQLA